MKNLSQCKEGDEITVQKTNGSGAFRKRLLEMGITKGTNIKIIKYAPLKDPLELLLRNYHLTLRVEEAEKIEVVHSRKEKHE